MQLLPALALACVAAACAQPAPPVPPVPPAPSASPAPQPSHCAAGERVQFSCRVGAKTVSLCAAGAGDAGTLSYRDGRIGQVELAHTADGKPERRFLAASLPLQPGAEVQQIWFNRGDTRDLLAVCVGGMCPQEAVLAVLRAGRVIRRQVCPVSPASAAWFAQDVVQFGNSTDNSHANARLADYDNALDQVFISRSTPLR